MYLSDVLKNDREIALEAVRSNGIALLSLCDKFRDDKEIVMEAIRNEPRLLGFVSNRLKADRDIVLKAIRSQPYTEDGFGPSIVLKVANEKFRKDREVVLEAVKYYGNNLKFADEKFKADKEIVREAIINSYCGEAIEFASSELRESEEMQRVKVENWG